MIEYLLFAIGIFLLIKGADYLIDGSSSLAKKLNIPYIVIGLTIVAFGTSMPEFFVTIMAGSENNSNIIFGNIIGSNIANILLILGISSFIRPMRLHHSTVYKEIPYSFFAALLLFILADKTIFGIDNNVLGYFDGILMMILLLVFFYYVYGITKDKSKKIDTQSIKVHSNTITAAMIIGGIIALYFGGKWTVDGAVYISRALGISEFFISATIIAIGTSLPELVTSVRALMKNNIDLSVGNIVGSNIINILFIIGAASLIFNIIVPEGILFDIIALLIITAMLFMLMFIDKKHELNKWHGGLFLLIYILYVMTIYVR